MKNVRRLLLREPLLPFLVLGTLAYFAYASLRPDDVETIEIRPATIKALVKRNQDLTGQPVTEERRADIVAAFIDDEVLIREALNRGLHETDARVRKRLLSIMRSGLTQVAPNPNRAQLEAYYNENRERYESGETIALEQVVFSWTSEKKPEDPVTFLAALEAGEATLDSGDFFLGGNQYKRATRRFLIGSFGVDFTDAVWDLDAAKWHGPVESPNGIHYVQVIARHPSTLPPFEDLEPYLRQEWIFEKTREGQQERIDDLRKGYEIVLPME